MFVHEINPSNDVCKYLYQAPDFHSLPPVYIFHKGRTHPNPIHNIIHFTQALCKLNSKLAGLQQMVSFEITGMSYFTVAERYSKKRVNKFRHCFSILCIRTEILFSNHNLLKLHRSVRLNFGDILVF